MTAAQLLFTLAMAAALLAAFTRGGGMERAAAVMCFAAALATPMVQSSVFERPEHGILAVDLLLLAYFMWLAMTADRFWPLWAAGFQIVGTTIHLARIVQPNIWPDAYAAAEVFWAYPVLVTVALGSVRTVPVARRRQFA